MAALDTLSSTPASNAACSTCLLASSSSERAVLAAADAARFWLIQSVGVRTTILPSTSSVPLRTMSSKSLSLRCARVIEMVGRTSMPASKYDLKSVGARWPYGSMAPIFFGSSQAGLCAIVNGGSVLVKSARRSSSQ